MLHSMRRKQGKKGYMGIKLDLEKAYDHLRWPFIREMLLDMKLPIIMVEVIKNYLKCTAFSVLWNGEETEPFSPS